MESGLSSSFIPRDAKIVDAVATAPTRRSNRGLAELLTLVSIVVLVASCALAAAVFLYQQFLTQQSASKLSSLKRAEGAFDPTLIRQITRLDDRMHAADSILSSHVAPSVFLHALDSLTLSTISFASLDLQAENNGALSLKMSGVGKSVNSVALQSDVFGKSGIVLNPIFSNIDRQVDGVHFNVAATINPTSVTYDKAGSPVSSPSTSAREPANTSGSSVPPSASSSNTSTDSTSLFDSPQPSQ